MEWTTKRSSVPYHSNWHYWFAWYPVRVLIDRHGYFKKVWLRTILRKGEYTKIPGYEGHWNWEYKQT